MLFWATISLSLALGFALLGFGGGAAPHLAEIARVLAGIFLVLFIAALVAWHAREEGRTGR